MKKDRYGRARVLTTAELDLLLEELPENHHVLAMLLRRTAARVSEGLQLKWRYVGDGYVLLTAPTTKGGRKTRTVPLHPELDAKLKAWARVVNPDSNPDQWVFPGRNPGEHMTRRGFDHALRKAADRLGLVGVSTHSFRRSFLTASSEAGQPLRAIQSISGHSSLTMLAAYIEVSDKAKNNCVMAGA
jgi:integrase/recombinase XerD